MIVSTAYDKLRDSMSVASALHHPGVVATLEVIESDAHDDFYIGTVALGLRTLSCARDAYVDAFISTGWSKDAGTGARGFELFLVTPLTCQLFALSCAHPVMEYVNMGQVMTYSSERQVFVPFTLEARLPEHLTRAFFRDIVEVVAYCTWQRPCA